MSIIDSRVVRRSYWLNGTDVAYQEYMIFHGPLAATWAFLAATGTRLFYASLRLPLTRSLAHRVMQASSGPSERTMDHGSFRCRVWGQTEGGDTAAILLYGKGDPANRITVHCACESALAIAITTGELPTRGGVLTPSTGLGGALVNRLLRRGIQITNDSPATIQLSGF